MDQTRIQMFVAFCLERHQVYVNKASGLPAPWTHDPILQQYRFCNVFRELDKVTVWIRKNWREHCDTGGNLWFWMTVARLVNHPDTLAELSSMIALDTWKPEWFVKTMDERAAKGHKTFGSAYIVSTNGHAMPKPLYLAQHVLTPAWAARAKLQPTDTDTLRSFHERLTTANGLGSFMAAQVVADVKNSPMSVLWNADDWWVWAAPGPGSIRGLARVVNGNVEAKVPPRMFLAELVVLRTYVNRAFKSRGWSQVCAQDLQNCLCEYDKYERARLGEGRPKQGYAGT
jgi:hypothetical protein